MHIPDGFLDARTAAITGILSASALALALGNLRRTLPARQIPLLGLSSAFVFAAQMLNFPVAGGTSGHMVGSVLIAVLLGPSAAVIALSAVLITQCLMFADGGLTCLGANILNMGLIGGVGGWFLYRLIIRFFPGLFGRILAASFAAWVSTVVAAIVCAGELAVSGTIQWSVAFPAMAGVHMLIGIGEALITALVLAAIAQVRPELLGLPAQSPRGLPLDAAAPALNTAVSAPSPRYGILIIYGSIIALGLALFVSPFACPWPDGLDKAAETLGFKVREIDPKQRSIAAPYPGYRIPGIGSPVVATSIAGAAGTIIAFGLAWVLAGSLAAKNKTPGT